MRIAPSQSAVASCRASDRLGAVGATWGGQGGSRGGAANQPRFQTVARYRGGHPAQRWWLGSLFAWAGVQWRGFSRKPIDVPCPSSSPALPQALSRSPSGSTADPARARTGSRSAIRTAWLSSGSEVRIGTG